VDLDRWRLESEWFRGDLRSRLSLDESCSCETFFGLRSGVVHGGRESWRFDVLRVGRGERSEARCVRCGLRTQLSEVEIRSSAVSDVHGLSETLLRVVSVEDDTVKDDGDALEDDLNETAN